MAMTATERSRVLRGRRTQSKVVLTVVAGEDELAEIARAGYAEAASTDRKSRAAAVSLFLTMRSGGSRNEASNDASVGPLARIFYATTASDDQFAEASGLRA
jgi:hypothetical protein